MAIGAGSWQRLLATLPVMGPIWHWSGLMEWSSLLGVLIRYQVPLPLALRLAAEGVSNPNVGQISLSLAEGVAHGRSLAEMMSDRRDVPASLVPLVRWGETVGNLAERSVPGARCSRSGSNRGLYGCGRPCPRSCLS